jgi:polyphosphate kinase 2 (PPK2 family)
MKKHLGGKKNYKKELKVLQYEMLNLQQHLFNQNVGLILVFEGIDAAGKGGAIKRVIKRLDPRGIIVHPISTPMPHEKRYHYLQRFWRKLPQHGQIGIFDRSWYGRVLVERVEGFVKKSELKRSYEEINEFEKTLSGESYILIKCWLHVSKDEQLKRFIKRKNNPNKKWKLTEDDWRNRKKWTMYEEAAEDMFQKTNTTASPWMIIGANDKKYARIMVLKRLTRHIIQVCDQRSIPVRHL